jgi:hypothetical protein
VLKPMVVSGTERVIAGLSKETKRPLVYSKKSKSVILASAAPGFHSVGTDFAV